MSFLPNARSTLLLFTIVILLSSPSSANIRDSFWVLLVRGWNTLWECGVPREVPLARPGRRILQGEDVAENGKWPWMAYLYYRPRVRDGFFCGATLIDTEWVVTAAHCIDFPNQPELYGVVLGERDLGAISGEEKYFKVSKVIKHPNYQDTTYARDIAMMKLSEPVFFSEYIRPACLPSVGFNTDSGSETNTFAGRNCTALGWGRTERKHKTDILQEVNLTVMPRILCNSITAGKLRFYLSPVTTESPQFCAFGSNGADTCFGDSGGPLLCQQNTKYYLHGITSYGPNATCGIDYPSIYSQVSKFREWMSLVIRQG